MRAGAQVLSLLAVPLNVHVLRVLAEESRPLADLRHAAGSPPQTTMRNRLRLMETLGVLERRRQDRFPGLVDCELTACGRDLVRVADIVARWLRVSPGQPAELGSTGARSTIRALADAWSASIVRALAARPLTLTELNRLISAHNYPALERRLVAMRRVGLIEACQTQSSGTPYRAGEWLRRAVGPLVAAADWERCHLAGQAPPLGRIDIEATFLLALPLVSLPAEMSGIVRFAVELGRGDDHRYAGVRVEVREGRIASCIARLPGEVHAWASGSVTNWLRAVLDGHPRRLECGGDAALAAALVDALHADFIGAGPLAPTR